MHLTVLRSPLIFFLKDFTYYLIVSNTVRERAREREHTQAGGGTEGEADPQEQGAQLGVRSQDPSIMT